MKPMLVGRVGVAMMQLVGGPLDGERTVAVVGAPCVIRNQPAPPRGEQERPGMSFLSWAQFPPVEGDEWKTDREKAEAREHRRGPVRYALYLPEITDGKATGLLLFGGEFLYTDATPQA